LSGAGTAGEAQVVQRVIEVPTGPLLAGQADVNVVLRPSDVVRIPPSKSGLVYISGQVNRPGPYNLPGDGRLTLLRALTSAGGLGALAIPERVDLTRVVGKDRQATIRLNLRAIAEQTQPDIYLKPDDMINVGTNFFAYPIAIIRSGFRMSYGFGFILDRNFAGDIWGADLQQTGF
jgi:polysaccharide export outer membrane protein